MYDNLQDAELFEGLSARKIQRLAAVGHPRALGAGEYLFLLGDSAQYLCVVREGRLAAWGAYRETAAAFAGLISSGGEGEREDPP